MGPIYGNFGNKADLLHHAVRSGRVLPKRDVLKCNGRSVTFTDGNTQEDVDVILMCTGYTPLCFDFLPEDIRPRNIRDLYKNIFSNVDQTVAFVGYSRPTQGSIPQLAELASIFVGKVFSGSKKLPTPSECVTIAKKDREDWEKFFRYSSGRVTGLVDGILYSTALCEAMGHPFSYLDNLRVHGFIVWMDFLFSPCTVHTFLGGIPEYTSIFRRFVSSHSHLRHQKFVALFQIPAGLYDLLFYQIGRAENYLYELFDGETRATVPSKYLFSESAFELWWLTRAWNLFCLVLLCLAAVGIITEDYTVFKAITVPLAIVMFIVHISMMVIVKFSFMALTRSFKGAVSKTN